MSPEQTVEPPRFESEPTDLAPLRQPLQFPFSGRVAPNPLMNAAMSERLSTWSATDPEASGIPMPELITLYRRWGAGGWGQLVTGNVMIDHDHLESPGNPIVPLDAPMSGPRFEAFQQLAAAGKEHGSLMVAQVGHAGRQTTVAPTPISASDVQVHAPKMAAMGKVFGVPRPATKEDIQHIVASFAHAAEYLEKAGFDGIQLHGAHGYLLAQFLSLTSNRRTDEYGGSLENRMRLILEVTAAIKAKISPGFVLGIKINSVEFQERGFTEDEATVLCEALEKAGFDYVETSGGTYEAVGQVYRQESTRRREAYFVEFSEQIAKRLSKTKVYTTGGLKTAAGMAAVLRSGVDGLGIGRAAAQEPDLPLKLLSGKVAGIMKYALGEDDTWARVGSAVVQIQQMGRGEEPIDLTDAENAKKVQAILAAKAA
ncbi:hypothetical protein PG999_014420 [Apiospora kogelbergensis]|uniref:NADH:flavin oxidoreductase/NADH oxidase N-terminal domain-containing protein n=1 Tax=Apiospora kogelbergensis TaxID=1337665 RepID=A0AAW0Q692_9PEZI